MDKLKERIVIYAALAMLCALTATIVGAAAGLWSFIQIVAVVELIYWTARPSDRGSASNFRA